MANQFAVAKYIPKVIMASKNALFSERYTLCDIKKIKRRLFCEMKLDLINFSW